MRVSRLRLAVSMSLGFLVPLLAAPPVLGQGAAGTLRVRDVTAAPRQEVAVKVSVTGSEPIVGFSISLDFDETLLEAGDVTPIFRADEGWGFFLSETDSRDLRPGSSGISEGFVAVHAVFDLSGQAGIPPGVETDLLSIEMRVRLSAPDGETDLELVDGATTVDPQSGGDIVFENLLTVPGGRDLPAERIAGRLTIRGPPVPPPPRPSPPRHYSLWGLSDHLSTIEGDGEEFLGEVVPAGDVDGDGKDDVLLRFRPRRPVLDSQDRVVVLRGGPLPAGAIDPRSPNARNPVVLTSYVRGLDESVRTQPFLAGGEDVDGDRKDDFLVASGPDPAIGGQGILLILGGAFGRALPLEVTAAMVGADVRGSIIVDSQPKDPASPVGIVMNLAGDIDGDGFGEAVLTETAGVFGRARAYVLFGAADLPPLIDLQEIGIQHPGLILEIESERDRGIRRVEPLGDIDGDGLGEIGVVTTHIRGSVGSDVFVVYGRRQFPEVILLDDIPGFGIHFRLYESVGRAGDLNGDGFDDIVLFQVPGGLDAGWAHVVLGRKRDALPHEVTFDQFPGLGIGFRIREDRDVTGSGGLGTPGPVLELTAGADLNADGKWDLLLGASNRHLIYGSSAALAQAGAAFVLLGRQQFPASLATNDIAKDIGFRIDGVEPWAETGRSCYLLNLDGDGSGDLLLVSREVACDTDPALRTQGVKAWLLSGRAVLDREAPPRLARVYPEVGPTTGGNEVLLFGRGFGGSQHVELGGRAAKVKTVIGDGLLEVEAPPGALPVDVPVRVLTPTGLAEGEAAYGYFRSEDTVLVVGDGAPRVQSFRHSAPGQNEGRGLAAGDFNGDGLADLAFADFVDPAAQGAPNRIELHLVFGKGTRGTSLDLDSLAPPDGVTLIAPIDVLGIRNHEQLGALHAGGDANGDGFDDLLLSVYDRGASADQWRLFLGRARFPADVPLSELPDTVIFESSNQDFSTGGGAAIVPDLTGDGFGEVLLTSGLVNSQASLVVVFGRADFPDRLDLETLAGEGLGTEIEVDLDLASVAGPAGDFNGDGRPDIFFGGKGVIGTGAVLVLYGSEALLGGGVLELGPDLVRDAGGLLLTGPTILGSDFSATVAGDLDGDGDGDLFLSHDNTRSCTLVPGSGEGLVFDRDTALREGFHPVAFPAVAELYGRRASGVPDFAASPAIDGVLQITSPNQGEAFGASSSPAGDFDADGFDDLVVGSLSDRAYIVLGAPDLTTRGPIDLGDPQGRAIVLEARGQLVRGGFDWDRDGADDVAIGSPAGRAEIVFGKTTREAAFIRGDSDSSGKLDITDAIFILGYLFLGSVRPQCLDALDADDDGLLMLTDAIRVLGHLFLGGPAPPAPFPEPGLDPTEDELLCRE